MPGRLLSNMKSKPKRDASIRALLDMRARIDADLARIEELSARLDELDAFERVFGQAAGRGIERREFYLELSYLAGADALSPPVPERVRLGPFPADGPDSGNLSRLLAELRAGCEAGLRDISDRYREDADRACEP